MRGPSTLRAGQTTRHKLSFYFFMDFHLGNDGNRDLLCIKNIKNMAAAIFWKFEKNDKIENPILG